MPDISLTLVRPYFGPFGTMLTALPVPYVPVSSCTSCSKTLSKTIGPASTLKLVDKDSCPSPLPESDPGAVPKGQHWVDLTDQGTVVVIEQPEGHLCAAIGGIMALRMKIRGAKGCVVGGRIRDLEELTSCGLPVSAPRTIRVYDIPQRILRSFPCHFLKALA